ncbi:MAG: FAD-binding oxidoreductase [Candidatus Omnitrophota bacterium]
MIIKSKKEDIASYLEDTSNLKGSASKLYIPSDKQELIELTKELNGEKAPFTVVSGRTGTTGGCVCLGGALISLENLTKIIDIDKEKKTARIEAGLSLESLRNETKKFNLHLAATPTEPLAFIGGAISTCASGVRGFGCGSIRSYVKSISIVLAAGQDLKINRGQYFAKKREFDFFLSDRHFNFSLPSYNMPDVKSQAGYCVHDNMDLIDLFIGSEGTLGVITDCQVALSDISPYLFDGLVFFLKEDDALGFIDTVKDLKNKDKLNPVSLEFFDAFALELLRGEYSFVPKAQAAVYFEQEALSSREFDLLLSKWADLIETHRGLFDKSIIADTEQLRRRIFDFRHALPQKINEILRQSRQVKAAADISVPKESFRKMYEFYKVKAKESGLNYLNFGHIGESHLHFNFLPKNDSESSKAKDYLKLFCEKAVSLGGTVSAEHGIGKVKKPYLKLMYSEDEIKQMAALKKYFDPNCLLGLDNIFDKEYLL